MNVYCTRPDCQKPANTLAEEWLASEPKQSLHCANCGMPLVLENHYLPLKELSSGGFGRTFYAWDLKYRATPGFQYECVIKQLKPSSAIARSAIPRIEQFFQDEGKVLQRLKHEQIPKLWHYFEVVPPPDLQFINPLPNQQNLFYLVQDYIEGQNLEEVLKAEGVFSDAQTVVVLEQILHVLRYVHKSVQGVRVIHRDIKPTNIMRDGAGTLHLIDFGAVKQIFEKGMSPDQATAIGAPGYMPPEQERGELIEPSSDLYSLAVTCIRLLTNKRPHELRLASDRKFWKASASVRKNLAKILDRMLEPEAKRRYQSADEVLEAMRQARLLPGYDWLDGVRQWGWKGAAGIGGICLIGGAIAYWLWHCPGYECQTDNRSSWGEEALIPSSAAANQPDLVVQRDAGLAAFRQGNYATAIASFQPYIQTNPNDPEIRIYLNNARAALTENPVAIAVVVPIQVDARSNPLNAPAEEYLRGVAQLQTELNAPAANGIQGRRLLVRIMDDDGNPDQAEKVARRLMQDERILAVIGNYTSDSTLKSGAVYGDRRIAEPLVTLSPTSTAVRQLAFSSNPPVYTKPFSDHVLRTASTDSVAAQDLATYVQTRGFTRAAVIFDSSSVYSQSLSGEFERLLPLSVGTASALSPVVERCDIKSQPQGLTDCVDRAKQASADVILLALTREFSEQAALTMFLDDTEHTILGGDAVYGANLLKAGRSAVGRLVLAIPWHRHYTSTQPKLGYEQASFQLWQAETGWRTATAYDAMAAIAEACRRTPGELTRSALFTALKSSNFSATGATGTVAFDGLGDRQVSPDIGVLVTIQPQADGKGYEFVLLPP